MRWLYNYLSRGKVAELEGVITRQAKEIEHWRRHSDALAVSRHAHAKASNERGKVIEYLEDKILEYWGN